MRRLDKGAPLRAAMKAAGLDIPSLAAKTREIDLDGRGISRSLIGFIVGGGATAREECSDRAARLISTALDREVIDLFQPTVPLPKESTSTQKKWISGSRKPLPAHLMDQRELASFLRKSMSWIDAQITEAKQQGKVWPGLIYVGSSRRFDPHAVLEALQEQRQPAA